jgi:hypothetical protein
VATPVGAYEVEIITGTAVDVEGVRAKLNLFSEQGGGRLGRIYFYGPDETLAGSLEQRKAAVRRILRTEGRSNDHRRLRNVVATRNLCAQRWAIWLMPSRLAALREFKLHAQRFSQRSLA